MVIYFSIYLGMTIILPSLEVVIIHSYVNVYQRIIKNGNFMYHLEI